MFREGQIVRCAVSDAPGLTRDKYYTVAAIQHGWVTVINDSGMEACFSPGRFRPVDQETLGDGDRSRIAFGLRSSHLDPDRHAASPMSEFRGNRQTILLVDDNVRLRHSTAILLRNLNYVVVEAGDAAEALDCLRADPAIQLMFTDIVMPGRMNGFELARAAIEARPDLKIILTTGFPLARHGRDTAQDFGWPLIGKPYRLRELGRHLANLLSSANASDELHPLLVSAGGN